MVCAQKMRFVRTPMEVSFVTVKMATTGVMARKIVKVCDVLLHTMLMTTHLVFTFVTTTDINECELDVDVCSNSSNRVCVDTDGSYICVCERGFLENTDGECEGEQCQYT